MPICSHGNMLVSFKLISNDNFSYPISFTIVSIIFITSCRLLFVMLFKSFISACIVTNKLKCDALGSKVSSLIPGITILNAGNPSTDTSLTSMSLPSLSIVFTKFFNIVLLSIFDTSGISVNLYSDFGPIT